jgi:hypothetical protein
MVANIPDAAGAANGDLTSHTARLVLVYWF